jgi:predicted ATPase/DNA-binding SARP family transcriptional activator
MYVRLLGEVAAGGTETSLERVPGSVPAALLAELALARGAVVATAVLEDALWDDPGSVSRNALQATASRLRGRLGPGSVEGTRVGYRLVGDVRVDLVEAETLLADAARALDAGALEDASATADRALALFVGPTLAGVDAPNGEPIRRRADEVRSRLAAARSSALARSGQGDEAAAGLRRELDRAPLDDRLVAGLLDALVSAGRATQAVQEYDRHRRQLADELGVDPSPVVQEAFARALAAGPAPEPGARRATLPVPENPLLGRDGALADLSTLVDDPGVRAVTVLGPGGMGKTRLALEVARTYADRLPGGAWWVPLAPLADPALVLPTVAGVLGTAETPDEPLETSIAAQVGDHPTLVVLDNAEHLLDACAAVVQGLVSRCTGLTVLITSREPLAASAEHRFALAPLADDDAVALLVARAAAAGGSLSAGDAATRIARRLDGLPLALELVAPRTTVLTDVQLLASLDAGLDALSDRRGGDTRHRSLRSTIAWSTDTLADDQRAVFAALSVLRGGFTLELAAAVCGATPGVLASLLDKSLIRRTTGRAGPRFAMLETVREYAAELAEPRRDELDERLATELARVVRGHGQRNPLRLDDHVHDWIADERDNLRTARSWAVGHRPDLEAELAAATWADLYFAGATSEAAAMLRHAVERCDDATTLASMLNGLVLMVYRMDEPHEALPLAYQELAAAERSGDPAAIVDAWRSLSISHLVTGDDEEEQEALDTTTRLAEADGDRWGMGTAYIGRANSAINKGELERGVTLLDDALAVLSGPNGTYARTVALSNKVEALLALGRTEEALPILLEVYDDAWFEQRVWAVDSVSKVAWAHGLHREALLLATAASAGFEQIHQSREGMTAQVHDALRAGTRAELGDEEADAVEAEGRAIGLDAAHARGHRLGLALLPGT